MDEEKNLYFEMKRFKREPSHKNELSFYNTLRKTKLFVPIVQGAGKTMIATIKKDREEEFYPSFASLKSFKKWPFELKEIRKLDFDSLKHIMLEDSRDIKGIVINPFSEMILLENKHIERIEGVTSGLSLRKTEGMSGKIYITKPKYIPEGLKLGMEMFSQGRKEIHEIYLYQAKRDEEDKMHWLFVIKFDGKKIELFPKLAAFIQL